MYNALAFEMIDGTIVLLLWCYDQVLSYLPLTHNRHYFPAVLWVSV